MAYLGADGSITGFNLFAYSDNNPTNMYDPNGESPEWIISNCNTNPIYTSVENDLQNNLFAYGEHHKKGTTNPSNLEGHQKGEERRRRDQGNEKGDARRKDRSNKRHKFIVPEIDGEKVAGGILVVSAGIGIVYLILNDTTGVGVLDDIGLFPAIEIFNKGISML